MRNVEMLSRLKNREQAHLSLEETPPCPPCPDLAYLRAASRFGAALALAFGLAFAAAAGRHDGDPLAVFAAQPLQSAVPTANPASPPAGVAARVSDRRITVSWDAGPGAGDHDYVVAVRTANGIVPFAWTEYDAVSLPYTIADMWAMSGLSYEVRVAVADAGGRSAWSPAVTVTAPVLQPAPAGAIGPDPNRPRGVGQEVAVALLIGGFTNFTNRSPWRWSVCAVDGSDCRLLPLRSPTWHYVIGMEAYGKRLRVQVDYDRGGVSRSASADLGVVSLPAPLPLPPPSVAQAFRACPRRPAAGWRNRGWRSAGRTTLETHLHALTVEAVRFGTDEDTGSQGGAVDALCDDLLVVTAWGRMVLVSGREARFLDGRVPMWSPELGVVRVPELQQHHPKNFEPPNFRVADILLRPQAAGRWRLFVTHHYAAAECIGFRLSSTSLRREGERVVVSPAWTTVLDFEPCTNSSEGNQVGGRMLPDGPNHLLAVVGDHGNRQSAQARDSNLGKLLRVDTGTGRAEVLARGLRNPQGLARDAEGLLWETEHGPRGGDELNVLEAGGNYGWPLASHGVHYDMSHVGGRGAAGRHDGFAEPVFFWTPSIGISSVVVNDARFFPLWGDDLLVGSLSGRRLLRIRRDGTDVRSVEEIYAGPAIRDMAQMPDGRIVLFQGMEGVVRFLSRSAAWCGERFRRGHVYSQQCPPAAGGGVSRGSSSSRSPPR